MNRGEFYSESATVQFPGEDIKRTGAMMCCSENYCNVLNDAMITVFIQFLIFIRLDNSIGKDSERVLGMARRDFHSAGRTDSLVPVHQLDSFQTA